MIDPTSSSPVGFNPLDTGGRDPSVTADTLLGIFESLFKENWGIRTADVLSAAFLTLARTPSANLLWLHPLLTKPGLPEEGLAGWAGSARHRCVLAAIRREETRSASSGDRPRIE